MSYEFFEHKPDVGIRGKGKTIKESLEETAKALFDLEVDLKKVNANKKINIGVSAENYEELLVEFLNMLLAEAGIKQMVFSKFIVKIIEKNKKFELKAEAWGEKLDIKKHKIKVEAKAATYSELKIYFDKKTKNWISQCIIDV